MKKHTLNISVISVLCILGAVSVGDTFAAGSVRALGGAGTYNGTTAAVTSSTAARGTAATRAGSLRVSPSTTRAVSTATRTNADGSTTTTERLSIGKYLGGATSVSTTGGSSSSGGATAAEIAEINNNINNLYNTTQTIEGDITNLENTKQDALTADVDQGIIVIDDTTDTVSIDMENLKDALVALGFAMGEDIELRYDGESHLEWRYANSDTWTPLMNLDDLNGDYVTPAALETAIATLATKASVDALDTRVTAAESDIEALQGVVGDSTDGLVHDVAANTAAISGLQTAVDNIEIPEQQQSDWAQTDDTAADFIKNKPSVYTTAQTDELLEAKANAADVYTSAETDELLEAKADAADVYTAAQTDELLADKADQAIIGDGFDTTNTVTAVVSALETKTDALPTSQNLAEVNQKISALETTVGDDTSGLVADVAELQDDMDSLADVAFSGDYADLDNTPTIPVVPTVVSAFENDVPYAQKSELTAGLAGKQDALDAGQLAAVNSGVTAEDVAQIGQNETAIGLLITNKAEKSEVETALAGKQNTISDLATIRSGAAAGATAVQPDQLLQPNWAETDDTSLAYIANKPSIPDGVVVDENLSTTSINAIQNKTVTNALPNFDTEIGGVVAVPSQHGAYVLGYVNGKPAYIAVVDGDGETGVDVPWGEP